MKELRGSALIAVILMASGLDFLLFGYDQGLFGGVLAGKRFTDMLGNPSPTLTGLVTAVYDIGCALGAVTAFIFGEKIGRKRSIIFANFISMASVSFQLVNGANSRHSHHRSDDPNSLFLLRADARRAYHSWSRCRFLNSCCTDLTDRDSAIAQPWLASGRSVWTNYHRCCHRVVALLRDALRQQQHAVSLLTHHRYKS